jgi:hypothetical protein
MKKEDMVLYLLIAVLIAAAVITLMFGGEKSRHGIGKAGTKSFLASLQYNLTISS